MADREIRHLTLDLPGIRADFLVTRLTGAEHISRLFEFTLDLHAPREMIDLRTLIGRPACVALRRSDGVRRAFHGLIARAGIVGHAGHEVMCRAVLAPAAWLLTRVSDCRIFQGLSIPQVVEDVLRRRGLTDYRLELSARYPVLDYCVQYRETDFNFISRLLEEVGIFYFFEHAADRCLLVLCDDPGRLAPCPARPFLTYRAGAGSPDRLDDTLDSWTVEVEVQPGAYAHTDFNDLRPRDVLLARSRVPDHAPSVPLEIFDYPGEYREFPSGEALARIRMEELAASLELRRGSTTARELAAGTTLRLVGAPATSEQAPHLVVSVRHEASNPLPRSEASAEPGDVHYACEFVAHNLANGAFRPPRTTLRPVVQGPQTAIVVGPEGREIHADEHGRVKVWFPWDRHGPMNESSTCWIRVSQPWAGKSWGAMFLPRIGQEVIVEFLEGDPDRPIITGRVYNAVNRPPFDVGATSGAVSGLRSRTTPSEGVAPGSEFRLDDRQGREQMLLFSPGHVESRSGREHRRSVGTDDSLDVAGSQFIQVGRDRHSLVTGNEVLEVNGCLSTRVERHRGDGTAGNHIIQVGETLLTRSKDFRLQADDRAHFRAQDLVLEASTKLTICCGPTSIVLSPGGATITAPRIVLDSQAVLLASGPGESPSRTEAFDPIELLTLRRGRAASRPGQGDEEQPPTRSGSPPASGASPVDATDHVAQPFGTAGAPDSASAAWQPPHWIEIALVDEDDRPVPHERYRVTLPDGVTVREGWLGDDGSARLPCPEPGQCDVQFPDLDRDSWEPADGVGPTGRSA